MNEFTNHENFDTNVTLFSIDKTADGTNRVSLKLNINVKKLEGVLEHRIRRGVENFFQAMITAFKGREPKEINIFLAGNSCKSPVVVKLFNEYIAKKTSVNQSLDKEADNKSTSTNKQRYVPCKLYLPLGVDNNGNMLENSEINKNFDKLRTGKTGVAFGLLRCRRGGKDIKIINKNVDSRNELVFPYFLGSIDERGYFKVDIGADIDYNIWQYFTYADEEEFELYYSKEPRSQQGCMKADEVRMVRCIIDSGDVSDDDEIGVYVRKISPNAIEYTIANATAINAPEYSGKIYKQLLE